MKIALIGYGKMGRMIEEIALGRGHEIVSVIDINNQKDFQSDAFRSADVAIEFTTPTAAYGNYLRAWEQGVKVVSGSTGWMKEHGDDVRQVCQPIPENSGHSAQTGETLRGKTLFWASNFSVGVAIFSAVNRHLAKIMNQFPQYDAHIEETHHIHKLDAPSGTAITLAEDLIGNLDRKSTWVKGEENRPYDPQTLRVDSLRRGEVPGIHTIRWDSEADCITITHDAHSRRGFALGAVLAAEYTKDHEGLLTMKDLFDF